MDDENRLVGFEFAEGGDGAGDDLVAGFEPLGDDGVVGVAGADGHGGEGRFSVFDDVHREAGGAAADLVGGGDALFAIGSAVVGQVGDGQADHGLVGHLDDVGEGRGLDLDRGAEAGADRVGQLVEADAGFEVRGVAAAQAPAPPRDGVGGVGGAERDALDGAFEDFVGVGGHADVGFLAGADAVDVGLVDARDHDQAREVGDLEQHGAGVVHGAGDGDLADFDVDAGDGAVDGRGEGGVGEVVLQPADLGLGRGDVELADVEAQHGGLQGGFVGGEARGGGAVGLACVFEQALADVAAVVELGLTCEVALCAGQGRAGALQGAALAADAGLVDREGGDQAVAPLLGGVERGAEVFGVELNHRVAGGDGAAFGVRQRGDAGGDAGAEFDLGDGFELAGGGEGLGEVAGGDGGEVDLERPVVGRGETRGEQAAGDGEHGHKGEQHPEDPGEGF